MLERYRLRPDDKERVGRVVLDVAVRARSGKGRPDGVALRWGMGEIMQELFGRVDPVQVRKQLLAALEESSPDGPAKEVR